MQQISLTFRLILMLLVMQSPLSAKKYYKHVDENGITHYSDKPPEDTEDFESYQIRAEDTKYEVQVVNRGTKQQPIFYAVNSYHGPVELKMEVMQQSNVKVEPQWPKTYILPPASDTLLATVNGKSKYRGWSFQYSYASTLGDPSAIHNYQYPYQLPFEKQQHYLITQDFNGSFSHNTDQSRHAIDINLPEGTAVLAAREGIVMDIADDFYDGGVESNKLSRGNYIRILHDDGSMAVYAHLQLESAVVAKGQQVTVGQHIANSGNTGFSSGPHLHFVVQINKGLRLESVPFVMEYRDGEIKTPKMGPI
jgi:murein DD-endopeptidase MepM/ murein hydrolase activator NlpD